MEMLEKSYGILLHRRSETEDNSLEFFLIKPNAPGFWGSRNDVWGFPKGRAEKGETAMETAYREFQEEVGMEAPELDYVILEPFKTSRGKLITIFSADAGDEEVSWAGSNISFAEYPPRSGNMVPYSETITGGWFSESFALSKLDGGYNKMIKQVIRLEKIKKMRRTVSNVAV